MTTSDPDHVRDEEIETVRGEQPADTTDRADQVDGRDAGVQADRADGRDAGEQADEDPAEDAELNHLRSIPRRTPPRGRPGWLRPAHGGACDGQRAAPRV